MTDKITPWTNETRFSNQVSHLSSLLQQSVRAWWPYVKGRATELAEDEPRVYGSLPAVMERVVKDLRATETNAKDVSSTSIALSHSTDTGRVSMGSPGVASPKKK